LAKVRTTTAAPLDPPWPSVAYAVTVVVPDVERE
jgi:hypothetical protein